MQHSVSDAETLRQHLLVLRCQAGDEHAFAALYNEFNPRTLRYLRGLLDAQVAEDVHQEVWLTVYQKIATLAHPRGFRTWLYQVTRRRAIDVLRREKRQSDLLQAAEEERSGEMVPSTETSLPSAVSVSLKAALEQLSPAHRDVLILRFWEEMSYAEIALVVGCSIGTVRSRLHHAKHHLRDVLSASPG